MDPSSAASHPLSPLITALCFTVLLSNWQTLTELEHPVLAHLRGATTFDSANATPSRDPSACHTDQDGGRLHSPASAVPQQEILLTMLHKAWTDAQAFLAKKQSLLTTTSTKLPDLVFAGTATEDLERVLALVLDALLVRLGVPIVVLDRWFQVGEALSTGEKSLKSPELPVAAQEYAQRYLVWQTDLTPVTASDLSQHVQSAMTRRITALSAGASGPLPQSTEKLPTFLRIYMVRHTE
ncbi:hypothetical protein H4R34_002700 [Dimargaris verticillata]|uniref:Uncharacterized protein n=1 Tax=Dimargaris verticillata TaxID=2761393 RepID=A0A9W8E9R4_9FUNG|nr:hypothetical protein H4R34_002700 [Dimargaris verticillata]